MPYQQLSDAMLPTVTLMQIIVECCCESIPNTAADVSGVCHVVVDVRDEKKGQKTWRTGTQKGAKPAQKHKYTDIENIKRRVQAY